MLGMEPPPSCVVGNFLVFWIGDAHTAFPAVELAGDELDIADELQKTVYENFLGALLCKEIPFDEQDSDPMCEVFNRTVADLVWSLVGQAPVPPTGN